jgi:hypothetical protein
MFCQPYRYGANPIFLLDLEPQVAILEEASAGIGILVGEGKMKKLILLLIVLLVSVTHAEPLPISSYYNGQQDEFFDLGSEGILNLRVIEKIYKDNEAQIIQDWTGYTGVADYVYGFQVFSEPSSTAALTYFAITGVNPSAITDVQNDIDASESLNSGIIQSGGIEPISSYYNASVTEAIWQFDEGTLIPGEQSWYLFLYSDYDIDEIGMTGFRVTPVPEPTTLLLLGMGGLLIRKRK